MKSRILLVILVLFFNILEIIAQTRSEQEAMSVAESFLSTQATLRASTLGGKEILSLAYTAKSELMSGHEKQYFYVFNRGENNGFIIVSADYRAKDILGYTESGVFNYENMPQNFKAWFLSYKKQLESLENIPFSNPPNSLNVIKQKTGLSVQSNFPAEIEPLIKTQWNQLSPYNNKCPDACPTGCVATVLAQILFYYGPFIKGTGYISYTTATNKYNLSANFEATTYDWANMCLTYDGSESDAQKDAVATLMFHCGVAAYSDYTESETPASFNMDLVNHFGLDKGMEYCLKSNYSEEQWSDLIKNELSSGRPVYYDGVNRIETAGHAFLCDGYRDDLFHINWGWGGYYDGYFVLSVSDINFGFPLYQGAMIGIKPQQTASGNPYLSISPATMNFTAFQGQKSFYIRSNTNWTISNSASWLTVSTISGANNSLATITVSANTSDSQRNATILVKGQEGSEQIINVTQGTIQQRSWKLTSTMSATLDANGLTISTTKAEGEAMPDFSYELDVPWSAVRDTFSSVKIIDKVTTIGSYAFDSHSKLTSITIPNSVISIGERALGWTPLTSITIPNSVTNIGANAFATTKITSINIPKYVTNIGVTPFYQCSELSAIEVDKDNLYYTSIDGVLYDKAVSILLEYPNNKSGDFVVPATVVTISEQSFDGGSLGLNSITLPASVSNIGFWAFTNCTNLTNVTVEWTTPLPVFDVFVNANTTNAILHVPTGTKALYQAAPVWKDFGKIVEYSPTDIKNAESSTLKAYVRNGTLHIFGLQSGKLLRIYNIAGQLIYSSNAKTTEEYVPLTTQGVFFIKMEEKIVKVINN